MYCIERIARVDGDLGVGLWINGIEMGRAISGSGGHVTRLVYD
jgi:hypothetical protein